MAAMEVLVPAGDIVGPTDASAVRIRPRNHKEEAMLHPRKIAAVLALGSILTATGAEAVAGTIEVGTTSDDLDGTSCSLRDAVRSANAGVDLGGCFGATTGPDDILLPAGDYVLVRPGDDVDATNGDLDVTEDLRIVGDGAERTRVDGNGSVTGDRVFEVRSSGALTLSKVGIHGGEAGGPLGGGGILAFSSVTLVQSTVRDNHSIVSGGGILAIGATATLIRSAVTGNSSDAGAAGIKAATVTVARSTVSGNSGVGIEAVTATLTDSTVSGNAGVGIDVNGDLSILRSTISGNVNEFVDGGGGLGGGIAYSGEGTFGLTNSTVSGNVAGFMGGGIWISTDHGTITIASSTITENVADNDIIGPTDANGGGIASEGTPTITLRNTILAGNETDPFAGAADCLATINSEGYNLFGTTFGCTIVGDTTGSSTGDPLLGPLAANGGFTMTHELLAGSPALDMANPAAPGSAASACPITDQRGVPRELGGRCDVGAYERVECFGEPVNIVGTPGRDLIRGTNGPDVILALAGNDTIFGEGGDDRVCAGPGDDKLSGEGGDDMLDGGEGDDALDGGRGEDTCIGGAEDAMRRCELE